MRVRTLAARTLVAILGTVTAAGATGIGLQTASASSPPVVSMTGLTTGQVLTGEVQLQAIVTDPTVTMVEFMVLQGQSSPWQGLAEHVSGQLWHTPADFPFDTRTVPNSNTTKILAVGMRADHTGVRSATVTLKIKNPKMRFAPKTGSAYDGKSVRVRLQSLPVKGGHATFYQCAGDVATPADVANLCDQTPARVVGVDYTTYTASTLYALNLNITVADPTVSGYCEAGNCTIAAVTTGGTIASDHIKVVPTQ